nr:histone H2A.Z-specific chaperone CHZ1-like [Drosophila virilis]
MSRRKQAKPRACLKLGEKEDENGGETTKTPKASDLLEPKEELLSADEEEEEEDEADAEPSQHMTEAADADEADEDMDEDADEDELADDLLSLSGDEDYDDDEELHSLDSFYSDIFDSNKQQQFLTVYTLS